MPRQTSPWTLEPGTAGTSASESLLSERQLDRERRVRLNAALWKSVRRLRERRRREGAAAPLPQVPGATGPRSR